jgi:hypothetical protein
MTATKSKRQQRQDSQKQLNRRLILVTGDKGGTGKSITSRILLDIYRDRGKHCLAYDCDQSNPQLARHYSKLEPGVMGLKLNERGGADALQDDLEKLSPDISLVDLPAGAAEYFEGIAQDIRLFHNAEQFGYRITMVSVLGRVKDSVNQLKRLVNFCQERVDYVVAKNLYWGSQEKFTRYDTSKTREAIKEMGGVEICIPELFDDIFDTIDINDLTFREALNSDLFTISNKSRIFGWLEECEAQVLKAAAQLALD